MADFQEFGVTRENVAVISTQTHNIAGKLVDSSDGHLIADFTGANSLDWPGCLSQLAPADQDEVVGNLAQELLLRKAGLFNG
jgi:hypothetical protein